MKTPESQNPYIDPDDWTPGEGEEVQMFGQPEPVKSKIPAPKRGSVTKSGAKVMSIGDWVKDSLENPGGLTFGFGTGPKTVEYSSTNPDLPTKMKGRYAFRATGPGGLEWSPSPFVTDDDIVENIQYEGDPSLDDFLKKGLVQSPYSERAFFAIGGADPQYIQGGGNIIVMDTEKARYRQNRTIDEPLFGDWNLRNPSYTTYEADIPNNATRLDRAMWQANPMNRTGIAILPQVRSELLSEVPGPKLSENPKTAFVLRDATKLDPAFSINQVTTTMAVDPSSLGGQNQHGRIIVTHRDPATALLEEKSITVDSENPVYDRITPFYKRPLKTHIANIKVEAQIARNTLPVLAKEASKSAGKSIVANPGKTMGAIGLAGDVASNWTQNYYINPQFKDVPYKGLATLADAVETSATNLVNPVFYAKGASDLAFAASGLEQARQPSYLPSTPSAIMRNYGSNIKSATGENNGLEAFKNMQEFAKAEYKYR